jgi:formate/nitrite transporter FocA (FNT family)
MILINTLVVANFFFLLISIAALVVLGFQHSVITGSVITAYVVTSISMRMLAAIQHEMGKLPGN